MGIIFNSCGAIIVAHFGAFVNITFKKAIKTRRHFCVQVPLIYLIFTLKLSTPTWISDAVGPSFCVTQFADDRHIKNRSTRVSLIFCTICRDCHIKNQSAKAFLGFGTSFYNHVSRLFAIFRGARKPTKRYIRLLIGFTMSNRQSLFFLFRFVLSISHHFVSSIILSVFAFLINWKLSFSPVLYMVLLYMCKIAVRRRRREIKG